MNYIVIGIIVKVLFSMCSIAIIWMVFSKPIIYVFKRFKRADAYRIKKQSRSSIYQHISLIYRTLYFDDFEKKTIGFFILSLGMFAVVFALLNMRISTVTALAYAGALGFTPYLFLRLKLRKIRVNSSKESDILINELINQYKINNYHILEALDSTAKTLRNAPNMKRHLYYFTLKLNQYREEKELNKIIDDFIFTVDTEWIRLLAFNIYIGVVDSTNVLYGFEDIQKDIGQAIKENEDEKRLNSESFTLIKFLAPGMYLGSIYLANRFMNMSVKDFFYYQFNTTTGLNYFILISILIIVDGFILTALKNKKFDI